MTQSNPYLEDFLALKEVARHDRSVDMWAFRMSFVERYAYAIPDEKALQAIGHLGRIVELGAGAGYWARMLVDRGVDVVAYDSFAKSKGFAWEGKGQWFPVKKGGPGVLKRIGREWSLLLCWPSYNTPFAATCLRAFQGAHLCYVGEGNGGCTADDAFHEALKVGWDRLELVSIPSWPGIGDNLYIYKRRLYRRREVIV